MEVKFEGRKSGRNPAGNSAYVSPGCNPDLSSEV